MASNEGGLLFSTINDIQLRFSTPVLVKSWKEASIHGPVLKRLIKERQNQIEGVGLSNRGGWQSRDDLFSWGGESITALYGWIERCIYQIHYTYRQEAFMQLLNKNGGRLGHRLLGWANVNKKGDWNSTHNHPNCHWSGCYYVQVPQPSGRIALLDPRPNINMLSTGNDMIDLFQQAPQEVDVTEGLIIIFPSWMQHMVTAHANQQERISIAFNWRFVLGSS